MLRYTLYAFVYIACFTSHFVFVVASLFLVIFIFLPLLFRLCSTDAVTMII